MTQSTSEIINQNISSFKHNTSNMFNQNNRIINSWLNKNTSQKSSGFDNKNTRSNAGFKQIKSSPSLEIPQVYFNQNISNAITETNGFWRYFSYGMSSIYYSDYFETGMFNEEIIGWGKEDLLFMDSCLQANLNIFKSVEKNLFHLYHDKDCLNILDLGQYNMCVGSKQAHYSSNLISYFRWLEAQTELNSKNLHLSP